MDDLQVLSYILLEEICKTTNDFLCSSDGLCQYSIGHLSSINQKRKI